VANAKIVLEDVKKVSYDSIKVNGCKSVNAKGLDPVAKPGLILQSRAACQSNEDFSAFNIGCRGCTHALLNPPRGKPRGIFSVRI
jgi:hypothetical protein